MMRIWSHPEAIASSTPYWIIGLSTMGSISLGWALVAGRKRVPRPAAGKTALRTLGGIPSSLLCLQVFRKPRSTYVCEVVWWLFPVRGVGAHVGDLSAAHRYF